MIGLGLSIPEVAVRGGISWLPIAGGLAPTLFADFATEGLTNHYWYNGTAYSSFAAWNAAIGGTFTRASSATYLQGGIVKTALSNVPRFPTDINGNPTGLRLTGAGTNLQPHSSISDSVASFTPSSGALTANAGTDPANGSTAASFVPTAGSSIHGAVFTAGIVLTGSTVYTFSAFVQDFGTNSYPLLVDPENLLSNYAWFQLTGAGTVLGTAGNATATITKIGLGYYFVSVTFTHASTNNVAAAIYGCTVGGSRTFTADGTSGWFMWGWQITQSAFPLDYIPTTTGTATQAADSYTASTGGLPFTGFNPLTGSVVSVSVPDAIFTTGFPEIWQVGADINHEIEVFFASSGHVRSDIANTGSQQDTSNSWPLYSAGQTIKYGKAWAAGDISDVLNGASPLTNATATIPVVSTLSLGNGFGANNMYGQQKSFAYWPSRISNASLQALTT